MAWLRVDDRLSSHPKFRSVSIAARWLWVEGACYAAEFSTDGYLSVAVAAGLVPELSRSKRKAAVAELERVGLREKAARGWSIHDYLDFNPSHQEVDERHAARAVAGHLGGQRSGKLRRSKTEANREAFASVGGS